MISSCRPVSLLDIVGKLFRKILLTRVSRGGNAHGLLRNETQRRDDMLTPSSYVEQALCRRQASQPRPANYRFSSVLETYLRTLKHCFRIGGLLPASQKVPWCSSVRLRDASKTPGQSSFFGEPIQWVQRPRYLGVTRYTRLTWTAHIKQGKKGLFAPVLKRSSCLPSETVCCF